MFSLNSHLLILGQWGVSLQLDTPAIMEGKEASRLNVFNLKTTDQIWFNCAISDNFLYFLFSPGLLI